MKRVMMTMTLAIVLAFSVGTGWAAEPPMMERPMASNPQVACAVQGGKINKDLYVDYQGQRIYFCCPQCIPIFKKNPEAYLRKMQQGVVPEPSPGGK